MKSMTFSDDFVCVLPSFHFHDDLWIDLDLCALIMPLLLVVDVTTTVVVVDSMSL